ncbi:MAG: alpha-hydroxy-acid oxidizing protein, partial [Acidobacteria bacterium]|nr:alpha-hydroxy-acid oxidizing protein [Acidobacteriota bacterium]
MLTRRGFSAAALAAPLPRIANLTEFEAIGKANMSASAHDYLAGGSASDVTLRANLEAWTALRLKPRALVDVSTIDTAVTLFGQRQNHPILFAPTAYHKLFHPEGERETVRGAHAAKTTLVASSFATVAIDEMTKAAPANVWFQLYMQKDRGFTRALIQRAEASGCGALVLTVDQPVRGYRDRDIRNAFTLPAGMDRANL